MRRWSKYEDGRRQRRNVPWKKTAFEIYCDEQHPSVVQNGGRRCRKVSKEERERNRERETEKDEHRGNKKAKAKI